MTTDHKDREKFRAAVSSVVWSLFLTGLKIWAGIATNSLGILSEAMHSGLDFCAAAMTFYAVRIAAKPADDIHQYGHEKVENLSALAETVLLLITCGWIVWEAVERLLADSVEVNLTWWAFAVVIVSIVVDVSRSAMLRKVAREHKSQALEADAMHFTTDIFSSVVVLLGLGCAWMSGFVDQDSLWHTILERADAVAGLVVAGIVGMVAWGLGKRAINILLDATSQELDAKIRKKLEEEASEYPLLKLRTRDIGNKAYVEATIGAPSDYHVGEAHGITEGIENKVRDVVPDADVLVHVEPASIPIATPPDKKTHAIALRYQLYIHGFTQIQEDGKTIVIMDVEMPAHMSIQESYDRVHAFQEAVKDALQASEVVLRIEPDNRNRDHESALSRKLPESVRDQVTTLCLAVSSIQAVDHIRLKLDGDPPLLSVDASVSGELDVAQCYAISSELEKRIQHALGFEGKVVVVLKPVGL